MSDQEFIEVSLCVYVYMYVTAKACNWLELRSGG